jgi:MOB kinase activator 1
LKTTKKKRGKRPNTFKGKKKFDKGSRRYELHKRAKETLGSGDLREAVKLPQGEIFEDWLAVNGRFHLFF